MLMAWLRLDISIHTLRKESDCRPCLIVVGDIISIHALRKESDKIKRLDRTAQKISIHALRKESDLQFSDKLAEPSHFNPRSP